ncbi:MAG: aminotransferase class III-fold pyridoxal phosphate-dependent enzyme [Spirochaetota bacterium]|nr:aminotransferase class III-fold pyridoxal phosphate-dependent enzyme [Spirochaetota bacterium]
MQFATSKNLISQASKLFLREDIYPFFVKRGKGSYLYDFDNNKFIDFFLNEGSLILGHANPKVTREIKNYVSKGFVYYLSSPLEIRLAKLIIECYKSIEIIRFTNNKYQAVNELIKQVQNVSGKEKIIFLGNYNDHSSILNLTNFDIIELDKVLFQSHKEIAAICIEPVATKPGLTIHTQTFWDDIKNICEKYKLILILDEEITGFRLGLGGGAEYYNISPDLVILGGIIGGGFPLYAYCGKKEYFNMQVTKHNTCYSSLHYVAGIETIKYLRRENPYNKLDFLVKKLCKSVRDKYIVEGIGSIFSIKQNNVKYSPTVENNLLNKLVENHLYFNVHPLQSHFISTTHTENDINKLITFLNSF